MVLGSSESESRDDSPCGRTLSGRREPRTPSRGPVPLDRSRAAFGSGHDLDRLVSARRPGRQERNPVAIHQPIRHGVDIVADSGELVVDDTPTAELRQGAAFLNAAPQEFGVSGPRYDQEVGAGMQGPGILWVTEEHGHEAGADDEEEGQYRGSSKGFRPTPRRLALLFRPL